MGSQRITLALAGNPNVGKSVVFNELTGRRQHVGNWPGKTVEKAEGVFHHGGREIHVVDLPGTYSLAAQSPEEVIARNHIISSEPQVVVIIVDATNLERNLNLTLQILELTERVVVALNLMDVVKGRGWEINTEKLEEELGVPVVPTVATEGKGLPELIEAVLEVADGRRETRPADVDYGVTVEGYLESLEEDLNRVGIEERGEWIALKLLEDDPEIVRAFKEAAMGAGFLRIEGDSSPRPEALQAIADRAMKLREDIKPDAKVEIVRRRFEFADSIVRKVMHRQRPTEVSLTERVDRIVTHRLWAWPIMLLLLTGVFWITIRGGEVGGQWLESAFSWLIGATRTWLSSIGAPWWVSGAFVDGMMMGTSTVIAAMLPPMIILFTAFALLEDIGVLPRVAFNLDRPMGSVGSQGKQCIVWGMCFGCNVTGVLASRIIENKKARLTSILTGPLIICSGSYGAAVALIIVLFERGALAVTLSLVFLSVLAAFIATVVLNRTMFRREPGGFVLEMPSYRRPKFGQVIWRALKDRVAHTMARAVMFAAPATVFIWILGNVPRGVPFERTAIGWLVSNLGALGQPLGLNGEMLTALLFALPAKEIIIPALSVTYGVQTALADSELVLDYLSQAWAPLVSYTFLVFFVLYLPCLVTVWAVWKETREVKWTLMGLGVSLGMATFITFLIYQGGLLLGF